MSQFQHPSVDDGDLGPEGHDPIPGLTGAADLDDGGDLRPTPRSALEELKALVDAEVELEPVTYDVPTRPGWSIRYSRGITAEQIAHWAGRAADKNKPGGLNQIKWGCLVLATQCEAILHRGQHPTETGQPITFRDPDLLALQDTKSTSEAVRRFYGGKAHHGDGPIVAQAYALLTAAGYDPETGAKLADAGDDFDELDGRADPTPR